jgi:Glyoxalase-like domain
MMIEGRISMTKFRITLLLAMFMLVTSTNGATQKGSAELRARVDHLVYATPDLNRGVAEIEKLLGVRATPGGQHPGRGTRNALITLGPATYLEIIAPDPEQPPPKTPRPFGIDGLKASRLVAWAAKGVDLERLRDEAVRKGARLGQVKSGSRRRPDGVLLSWRYTDPQTVLADGLVPFFIDWGQSPHPAQTAAQGASLIALRAEHPDAQQVQHLLRKLGLELPVQPGAAPALVAIIDSPRGRVELR